MQCDAKAFYLDVYFYFFFYNNGGHTEVYHLAYTVPWQLASNPYVKAAWHFGKFACLRSCQVVDNERIDISQLCVVNIKLQPAAKSFIKVLRSETDGNSWSCEGLWASVALVFLLCLAHLNRPFPCHLAVLTLNGSGSKWDHFNKLFSLVSEYTKTKGSRGEKGLILSLCNLRFALFSCICFLSLFLPFTTTRPSTYCVIYFLLSKEIFPSDILLCAVAEHTHCLVVYPRLFVVIQSNFLFCRGTCRAKWHNRESLSWSLLLTLVLCVPMRLSFMFYVIKYRCFHGPVASRCTGCCWRHAKPSI